MRKKQRGNEVKMIEYRLVQLLIEKKIHITTAESCTGGMIASEIINVPDASKVFDAGFITYADGAKVRFLDVPAALIEEHGVVSEPVAGAMAEGAAKQSRAEIAVSTSGIAGPGGGSDVLPVGTVCFGFYINGSVLTETRLFYGDRQDVRKKAAEYALERVLRELTEFSNLSGKK